MMVVSACLAGVRCRYNGQAFPVPAVVELVQSGQAIPLCPEILGGLPTPRPSAERRGAQILTADGVDVTEHFRRGARLAAEIARLVGCTEAILKARSPSCGCGRIYDGSFSGAQTVGDGLFCILLKEEGIRVITEEDI